MEFSLLKYAGPNTEGVVKVLPEAGGSILKAKGIRTPKKTQTQTKPKTKTI